ncbi:MAG: hypothetical protein ACR2N5_05355, partial [Solirubrobacterales bacterium]
LAATTGFLAANVIIQVARIWLALAAVGVSTTLPLAAMAFLLFGLFQVLNLGAASSAGAMVVVFGSQGVATATAVGVLILATALLGGLVFAIVCTAIAAIGWRREARAASPAAAGHQG